MLSYIYYTTQKFAGIYTEDTCAERWKLHHYLAHHRVFQTNSSHEANDGELEAVISLDQGAPSNGTGEVQESFSSISKSGPAAFFTDFKEELSILQTIKSMWDYEKELVVMELDASKFYNPEVFLCVGYCSNSWFYVFRT